MVAWHGYDHACTPICMVGVRICREGVEEAPAQLMHWWLSAALAAFPGACKLGFNANSKGRSMESS